MPLTEKVSFKTRLQRGNRVQVPKIVRWRYKLETYQILEVTINPYCIWGSTQSFFARMSKDGRLVIPKLVLALSIQNRPNEKYYVMEVTLRPS